MSLLQCITEYLEHLEVDRDTSILTIQNYRHYLTRLNTYLTTIFPSPTVKDITVQTIHSYRLFLSRYIDEHGIPLQKITQNYHLIAIRSFLTFCLERHIDVLAPDTIMLVKIEKKAITFLQQNEIERLLSMPTISTKDGLRDKALLELLYATGLRVSEVVSLNRDYIDGSKKEVRVVDTQKKLRTLVIPNTAIQWIQRYIATRDDTFVPLFIRYSGIKPKESDIHGNSRRLTVRSVQRIVEKYVKKARLSTKITPHGIRHSFAKDQLTHGTNLETMQGILGHKHLVSTRIYQKINTRT
jgi:site-specific recombinase XerD